MFSPWRRCTYWQLLWQPVENTQSRIDVWAEQLWQQTGGPDGLWWPCSRFNTPVGETRAFISSLLPYANTLGSYQWPYCDKTKGHFIIAVKAISKYQREDACGNSDLIHWLNQSGQTWDFLQSIRKNDLNEHIDVVVLSAKVTANRPNLNGKGTHRPKQVWSIMLFIVHKVPMI